MPLSLFHQLRAATTDDARLSLRNQIVEQNTGLVAATARRLCERFNLSFAKDGPDLIGEGNLGLINAVERFDPDHEKGASFSTFATRLIESQIAHYLRNRHGLTSARVAKNFSVTREGDLPEGSDFGGDDQRAGEAFESFELRNALAVAVAAVEAELTTPFERETWARSKRAVELKYIDGLGPGDIADQLNETPSNVCNMIKRALARLHPHMRDVYP